MILIAAKLIKKLLKVVNSNAAPWQVASGAALGVILGFLPVWPDLLGGPAPIGFTALLVVLFINVHLAAVLLLLAVSKVVTLVAQPAAVSLGNALDGMAKMAADQPLLYACRLNHTGHLGFTLIGLVLAPLAWVLLYRFTVLFRDRWRAQLLKRKQLMIAGKLAGNGILLRVTCWFFGL